METVLKLNWKVNNSSIHEVTRYCHSCGKKVIFRDSLKRRQNANGKNIYHYAIYKCSNGHTWNKKIENFKSKSGIANEPITINIKDDDIQPISIEKAINDGFFMIEIAISINVKQRIDKLLAIQILDMSRSKIIKAINQGYILLDGILVKSNTSIRDNNIVTLYLNEIKKM